MNPARMLKKDLVTLVKVQECTIEARDALVAALRDDVVALSAEIEELRAQAQPLQDVVVDARIIADRGQLMRKMRELSVKGVPCHMLGDAIRHTKTGSVLAQVGRPYPLPRGN